MTRSNSHRRGARLAWVLGMAGLAVVIAAPPVAAANAKTLRVSVSSGEAQANGASGEPSTSRTGRYVAFASVADDLVGGDTNERADCFLRDHDTGETERVSLSSGEEQGNNLCDGPAISNDGRYVAFESRATNLVPNDDNGTWDIFVRDVVAGTTERVSVRSNGDEGDAESRDPGISGDGRYVVFESFATNLVGNDTNGRWDVFVHDRDTGQTVRASVRSNGSQGDRHSRDGSISANGRFVVFESFATNLAGKDTNGDWDIYLHDLISGKTSRVSKRNNGGQPNGHSVNPTVSADGRYVAFDSGASNLVRGDTNSRIDVFVRDRKAGKTKRVSVRSNGGQGSGHSQDPTISHNGRWVAFNSAAPNLVPGDTNKRPDGFVRDLKAGKTKRISVKSGGKQATGGASDDVAISGNGKFVAFESNAKNLVANDTNKAEDIFRRGPLS